MLCACKREEPPPALPEQDPMEAIAPRAPKHRLRLGAPAIATRAVHVAGTLSLGMAGVFYGVDTSTGALRWKRAAAPALFRPMADERRLVLPHVDQEGGVLAEVEPVTGKLVRQTRLRQKTTGELRPVLNTAPTLAERHVIWPSSQSLFAFALADGQEAWRYDSDGPTPYRRFQFGSEPARLDDGVVYWAHQKGLAAVDLQTGKQRWAWPGYRGFALRPVLSPELVVTTSDKEVVALDRASGAVSWYFGPEGLRFEHLASEDMAGYSNGVYWFVGEPMPFHYWLIFLDAKTGRGRAASELFGRGLQGSIAQDGVRLYARLGEWLVAYQLATAKPLWRLSLGSTENGSSPTVAGGKVWIVSSTGELLGCDAE